MAIVYPQAQDPRLQAVQIPMQVNAPAMPAQMPGGGSLTREQMASALQSQNPLLAAASEKALAAEQARMQQASQENIQAQEQEAANVAQQAEAQAVSSMAQALPSDAEMTVAMKDGGLVKQAQKVQQQGRHGDSMLVHMNPDEYNAMTALGGLGGLSANQVTINPETGLPEMFSFKDVLPTIVGIAGAAFGLPTWAVALGTGATTAITTGDIGKGLMAGLGSYALGSLAEGIGTTGTPPANLTDIATTGAGQAPVAGGTLASSSATSGVNAADLFEFGTSAGAGMPVPAGQVSQFANVLPQDLSAYGSGLMNTPSGSVDLAPAFIRNEGFRAAAAAPVFNQTAAGEQLVGMGRELTVQPVRGGVLGSVEGGVTYGPRATRAIAGELPAATSPMMNTAFPTDPAATSEALSRLQGTDAMSAAKAANPNLTAGQAADAFQQGYKQDVFQQAPFSKKLDYIGEGISKIGQPGGMGYLDVGKKALLGGGMMAGSMGAFDPEEYDYSDTSYGGTMNRYVKPDAKPLDREVNLEGFDASRAGIDPQFRFFAKDGKKGGLDTIYAQTGYSDVSMAQQGINQPQPNANPMMQQGSPQAASTMQSAIMQAAKEVASNSAPQGPMPRPRTVGLTPNAAVNALFGANQNVRMQEGGVPSEAMMAQEGIMDVASEEVKNNLNERMSVTPSPDQPQNAEERAIYDRAMLAVQGMLEPEEAQMAINEFIETFGPEAYNMISELARNPRDEGGVIKPANGDTTVADGAMQGEDIIAGKIVDPDTGEETANLRVGENEYIEPADSLSRRAMAAGLAGTPENGARVRGMEEEQLRQAFG